ncbi:MAG: hypothetical protein ACT4R6_01085 [Gemmatimonadaceae bacterium]
MKGSARVLLVAGAFVVASSLFAGVLVAQPAAAVARTRGLFLGLGGAQLELESDEPLTPDETVFGVAGRIGYGFGDYLALVVGGDLSRVDMIYDVEPSEFEFAHIAIGARLHPFRAWRIGPYVEGAWLRYSATGDRTITGSTSATSRVTLEGNGAGGAAGLHLFLSRAASIEASAAWTGGKLTKATEGGVPQDFSAVALRSRLYRLGLTWWLGT